MKLPHGNGAHVCAGGAESVPGRVRGVGRERRAGARARRVFGARARAGGTRPPARHLELPMRRERHAGVRAAPRQTQPVGADQSRAQVCVRVAFAFVFAVRLLSCRTCVCLSLSRFRTPVCTRPYFFHKLPIRLRFERQTLVRNMPYSAALLSSHSYCILIANSYCTLHAGSGGRESHTQTNRRDRRLYEADGVVVVERPERSRLVRVSDSSAAIHVGRRPPLAQEC